MNHFEKNEKNNYPLLLQNFHYWENRKLYLELMERFIDKRIDGTKFASEFYQMWCVERYKTYSLSSKELFNKLKREHVDLTKLEGLSDLLTELFIDCEVFQPDSALRKDYQISEEELRNFPKRTLLEIKNRYFKESSNLKKLLILFKEFYMLVKSIRFPTSLEDIPDNDFIDVSVELEDVYRYIVDVGTAKNIEYLKDKMNYFELGEPFIIVKRLTKEIIEETIKAYANEDDGHCLKLCNFAGRIDKTVFDKLQAEDDARNEYEERRQKLDELDNS